MRAIAVGMLTFFSLFLTAAGAQSAERWAELPAFPAMPAPKTSGMADVNDIKMYYAEYGEGDPILFIHGGLGNTGVWGHQIAENSPEIIWSSSPTAAVTAAQRAASSLSATI